MASLSVDSLLTTAAFALCPHSVVQYDVVAGPRTGISTADMRDAVCRDLPGVDAWNRVLDEACLHQARMRNGPLRHLGRTRVSSQGRLDAERAG
jgi:hypothetical protein